MNAKVYGPYYQMDSKWQADGSHLEQGWYFRVTNQAGDDIDVAGPFDDEHECEMAMRRADQQVVNKPAQGYATASLPATPMMLRAS